MKNVIKLSTTAALLLSASQVTFAENRVPAELAANISPEYRSGDMQAAIGKKFVWVKRIEGRDRNGNVQVLFNEPKGALIPMDKLTDAHKLINPSRIEKKGPYSELRLQLADTSLTLEKAGMKHQPLPTNIASNLVLRGKVEVKKFEVSSNGLSLTMPDSQLAMLDS